jgi:uncharacterized membrane protein (UPF0127 family)
VSPLRRARAAGRLVASLHGRRALAPWLVAAALAVSPGAAAAPGPQPAAASHAPAASALPTTHVVIGGEPFTLEVARDPAAQYRGLGGRTSIDRHGGMLFVFPVSQILAFVMRDCPIPIDVAFLDADGRVVATHEMQPEMPRGPGETAIAYEQRLHLYGSGLPAHYAIEMAGGRLRELGVHGGDAIELPPDAR